MRLSRSAMRFGAALALVWLAWLIVLLVAPGVIEAAYEQRSLGFLNAMISGRDQHELSRYIDLWTRLARLATIGLAVLSATVLALYPARHRLWRVVRPGLDAISFRYPARWRTVAFQSIAVGLAAGTIEVVFQAVTYTARGWPTGDFYWDKIWLAPLAMALSMLLLGSLMFPLTRPWRAGSTLGLLPAAITAIGAYGVIRAVGGIHPAAAAVLAAGFAVAVSRAAVRTQDRTARRFRLSGLTLAVLIGMFGIGLHGKRLIGEWWQVRAIPDAAGDRPNVLMIILDTVRAPSMGLYGHDRRTTPNIDGFAQRGVVFDRAWAPAAWTLPSHASLFTGRPASELPTDYLVGLDDGYRTLAEVLTERGYTTAGFVANFYYAGRQTGLAQGFAHYEDHPITVRSLVSSAWLTRTVGSWIAARRPYFNLAPRKRADRINRDFFDWLDSGQDRPFFAFLNYLDAHHPYDPPEPYRSRFGGGTGRYDLAFNREYPPDELRSLEDHYDGALAWLDANVGQLLERLDETGVLDNTLVIITADHGEEFGEHGPRHVMHGRSLYSPGLHVPLILVGPGRVPDGRRIAEPVALANVGATILDLIGHADGPSLSGRSLAPLWSEGGTATVAGGDTIISVATQNPREARLRGLPIERGPMRSVLVQRWHLIVDGAGEEELYDVFDDPWEQSNLIASPAGSAKAAEVRSLIETAPTSGPAKPAHR